MLDIFETVVAKAAGITKSSPLKGALALRSDILELTENSHDASLRPNQPGGLNHAERAGLACRIAKRNNESVLARHYETMFGVGSQSFANTEFDGGDDARAKAILRHTDLVTLNPKEATADDVLALRTAGLDDADIVRLSELIAFVSYQIRVVAGLRLMAEVA
jgi:uncharacterized protein YciW